MKFSIDRAAFARALKLAAAAADAKSPMPALAMVHLRADKTSVHVAATDLVVGIVGRVKAKVAKADSASVDARAMLERVASMPADEITVERAGSTLTITAGRARFSLPCVDGRDAPKILATDAVHDDFDAAMVRAGFAGALTAVCHDSTRFHLSGVYVDGVHFVATDGHRMLTRKIAAPLSGKGRIVPERGVTQILRILDGVATCGIAWTDHAMFVRVDETTLSIKLTDAQFPLWGQVIPPTGRAVSVDRAELADVIDRARKVAGDSVAVVLSISVEADEIAIATANDDRGDYSDVVPLVAPSWSGKPLRIGVNGRFMSEALAAGSTDIAVIQFPPDVNDPELQPILITMGDQRGVVMPMRIP